MAKFYDVNFSVGADGGAEAIFRLKQLLVSAGWTVTRSSDGTNVGSPSNLPQDRITSATVMNGSLRWFVIREPTGAPPRAQREWCFQRDTSDNRFWRVKISPVQGFVTGGTTTQTPSASDQGLIRGAGSDASPTFAQLFNTAGTYKMHAIALDTAYGSISAPGNDVYPFWFFTNVNGNVGVDTAQTFICQEPLAVGSYPQMVGTRTSTSVGDADPAVYACVWHNSGFAFGAGTRYTANELDLTFEYFHSYSSGINRGVTAADDVIVIDNYPAGLSTTPSSVQDPMLPLFLGRSNFRTTFIGYKGATAYIRRAGLHTGARASGDTVNLTTDAYIYLREILVPWPESVTPVF